MPTKIREISWPFFFGFFLGDGYAGVQFKAKYSSFQFFPLVILTQKYVPENYKFFDLILSFLKTNNITALADAYIKKPNQEIPVPLKAPDYVPYLQTGISATLNVVRKDVQYSAAEVMQRHF